jgi:hypothetical protein
VQYMRIDARLDAKIAASNRQDDIGPTW